MACFHGYDARGEARKLCFSGKPHEVADRLEERGWHGVVITLDDAGERASGTIVGDGLEHPDDWEREWWASSRSR